ncbi:MAG: Proline--tRNA ligase [Candidatus Methanoperedenaceae archaeon GB37]|nr:MAG: Proline--tRNA ligase [Candidatus Methanoperedenaceae archaeon GB37]
MYYSRYFLPTLKETPSEAEINSHRLMLRAGMIRKLTAGIYSYLPFGLTALRKVENIVREEMNRAGAQEVLLPTVQPAELWQASGRWERYGKELLRFKDRHERFYCMGPTHEEVITDLVRKEVRSYRDLPLNLYQIQTKFRDEIRPRFGLMRSREFIMKDGYSFDIDDRNAEKTYWQMYDVYKNIFTRCDLDFKVVEAETGTIGGSFSHEFMVLAEVGEDTIVFCQNCDYAANIEKAEVVTPAISPSERPKSRKEIHTPNKHTVEEITEFLNVSPQKIVKTIIYLADEKPVAVLVRGDHDINEIKLQRLLDCRTLIMAPPGIVKNLTKAEIGFAGPIGLNIPIIADNSLKNMVNFVTGANKTDYHFINVNLDDFKISQFADVRFITSEDRCPRCRGELEFKKGIEVGHIFKLGTKYSEALKATYLDAQGKEQFIIMGCYGIGIGRTLAAIIEQHHDENGIIFPLSIAPFQIYLLAIDTKNQKVLETAEKLYGQLSSHWQVFYDNRDERPGIKFKDADLIGIPLRITLGRDLKKEKVEVKIRKTGETLLIPITELKLNIEKIMQTL